MTEITMLSDMTVKLVRSLAHDDHVVQAAQVSIKGENNPNTNAPRLIDYLMRDRHGSPFEHSQFTFFVKVPIFVAREWFRHRLDSYNEFSGRYSVFTPEFYTPDSKRKMQNIGTSAAPQMAEGTEWQKNLMAQSDLYVAQRAWDAYQSRLEAGIANELARTILPVSTYTQFYWTVNPRSLMNFISLRTDARTHGIPEATVFSRPQREIEMAAEYVESAFANAMPATWQSFNRHGRIAP